MEILQLRCFLRVAREQHFGRAAESLHMSTSTVSRIIKALETELGTTLFERGHHTVELTEAGQVLAFGAGPLLDELEDLKSRVSVTAETRHRPIIVGGSPIVPPFLFDRLTGLIRDASDGRVVHVDVADWTSTLDRIARNQLDVALYGLPIGVSGVDFRTVAKLELGVGIRSDDPLAHRNAVTWKDVRSHRLIISKRTRTFSTINDIRDQSERAGHRLVEEVLELDVTVLATQVRTNVGKFFLALPPGTGGPWKVLDDSKFTFLPFEHNAPVLEFCLVWNQSRYGRDPRLTNLVNHMLERWDSSTPREAHRS